MGKRVLISFSIFFLFFSCEEKVLSLLISFSTKISIFDFISQYFSWEFISFSSFILSRVLHISCSMDFSSSFCTSKSSFCTLKSFSSSISAPFIAEVILLIFLSKSAISNMSYFSVLF